MADEIDGIESKSYVNSDIIEYLNYESTKYYKENLQHKTKKKLKRKKRKNYN